VGSRITWAPEVIKKEPYRFMSDWWSVGIIIYQLMMRGKTPFNVDKPEGCDDEVYKKMCDDEVLNKDISGKELF